MWLCSDGDKAMRVADIHLQRTPLTFKHFRDEAITKALQLCCSLLGYYGKSYQQGPDYYFLLDLKLIIRIWPWWDWNALTSHCFFVGSGI